MKGKEAFEDLLEEILEEDRTYPEMAYQFVMEALNMIIASLPSPRHVSGEELCYGCRDVALEQFGLLAHSVLNYWNIKKTEDLGEIVFKLVEKGLLAKTENDLKSDFIGVFDFNTEFDVPVAWGDSGDN